MLSLMADDIFSSNWRESQKTKETYSYLSDIIDEKLKELIEKHYETKSKDVIEYERYFFFPIQFEDKETKKPVQMIYRYTNKDKALARASSSSGGGKQFAPRKEYYKTYEEAIPVPLTDYQTQANERAKGKQVLTAEMVGSNGAVFYNPEGTMCILMGKVFKVEL